MASIGDLSCDLWDGRITFPQQQSRLKRRVAEDTTGILWDEEQNNAIPVRTHHDVTTKAEALALRKRIHGMQKTQVQVVDQWETPWSAAILSAISWPEQTLNGYRVHARWRLLIDFTEIP